MSGTSHAEILAQGPRVWNAWRAQDGQPPDLRGLRLPLGQKQMGAAQGGPIDLSHADLTDADLRNATLTAADFRKACLVGADLTQARLAGARLDGANLTLACLAGADLKAVSLAGAQLDGADLSGVAGLTEADIAEALGSAETTLPTGLVAPAHWSERITAPEHVALSGASDCPLEPTRTQLPPAREALTSIIQLKPWREVSAYEDPADRALAAELAEARAPPEPAGMAFRSPPPRYYNAPSSASAAAAHDGVRLQIDPLDALRADEPDLYARLGLRSAATAVDLRAAYLRLARALHPDLRPGDPNAEQRLKRVNAAFAILRDDSRRHAYDAGLIDAEGNDTTPIVPVVARRGFGRGMLFAGLALGAVAAGAVFLPLAPGPEDAPASQPPALPAGPAAPAPMATKSALPVQRTEATPVTPTAPRVQAPSPPTFVLPGAVIATLETVPAIALQSVVRPPLPQRAPALLEKPAGTIVERQWRALDETAPPAADIPLPMKPATSPPPVATVPAPVAPPVAAAPRRARDAASDILSGGL